MPLPSIQAPTLLDALAPAATTTDRASSRTVAGDEDSLFARMMERINARRDDARRDDALRDAERAADTQRDRRLERAPIRATAADRQPRATVPTERDPGPERRPDETADTHAENTTARTAHPQPAPQPRHGAVRHDGDGAGQPAGELPSAGDGAPGAVAGTDATAADATVSDVGTGAADGSAGDDGVDGGGAASDDATVAVVDVTVTITETTVTMVRGNDIAVTMSTDATIDAGTGIATVEGAGRVADGAPTPGATGAPPVPPQSAPPAGPTELPNEDAGEPEIPGDGTTLSAAVERPPGSASATTPPAAADAIGPATLGDDAPAQGSSALGGVAVDGGVGQHANTASTEAQATAAPAAAGNETNSVADPKADAPTAGNAQSVLTPPPEPDTGADAADGTAPDESGHAASGTVDAAAARSDDPAATTAAATISAPLDSTSAEDEEVDPAIENADAAASVATVTPAPDQTVPAAARESNAAPDPIAATDRKTGTVGVGSPAGAPAAVEPSSAGTAADERAASGQPLETSATSASTADTGTDAVQPQDGRAGEPADTAKAGTPSKAETADAATNRQSDSRSSANDGGQGNRSRDDGARVAPDQPVPAPVRTAPPEPTAAAVPPAAATADTSAESPDSGISPVIVAGGDAARAAADPSHPLSVLRPSRGSAHAPAGVPGQIAVHIQKNVKDGNDRFTIQLRPEELGRIDIRLEFAQDGKLSAHVAVEKAQTLELLQKDARGLERALQDAGVNADSGSLSFSLSSNGNPFQSNEDGRGRSRASRRIDGIDDIPDSAPTLTMTLAPGRVDVRV